MGSTDENLNRFRNQKSNNGTAKKYSVKYKRD